MQMEKLSVGDSWPREKVRLALEAAFLLGFQTESAKFPVAGKDGTLPVPECSRELEALFRVKDESGPLPEDYEPAKSHPEPVFDLDFRKKRGLEYLFSRGMFLKDEDSDYLPDRLDVKFVLPDRPDAAMLASACSFAFRFGMETTGFTGDLLAEPGYEGPAVLFEDGDFPEAVLAGKDRVVVRGRGQKLVDFTSALCEIFPQAGGWRNWREVLMDMADDMILRRPDGQLAALKMLRDQDKTGGPFTVSASPEMTDRQRSHFPGTEFRNYKEGRVVYEKKYELPWEVDTFENLFRTKVLAAAGDGSEIRVEGAVSEDEAVRGELMQRLRGLAEENGARLTDCSVLCAYKQGFSWISEKIIPQVRGRGAEKVEIFFRPFLPEGQTEWLDENGATPSYHNLAADNPDKWYDLPIRYLQELYPIEDVLVRELGIPRDAVIFRTYDGTEDITYLCRVTFRDGGTEESTYLARYSERPYLDEYPKMGKVHPSTGYIRAWVDGREVLNQKVQTDLEEIWDIYQSRVLPECRQYAEKKFGGTIRPEDQPLFQRLVLDISVSEPDYRVGCREDMISSLDALLEDLYFTGTDYFKNYGVHHGGAMLDAPGLLLPQIHNHEGAPVFRVTLFEPLAQKPKIESGGRVLAEQGERGDAELWIRRIRPGEKEGEFAIELGTAGVSGPMLQAYAALLGDGVLEESGELEHTETLSFVPEDGKMPASAEDGSSEAAGPSAGADSGAAAAFTARLPEKPAPEPPLSIQDIDISERSLIGYDRCCEIFRQLARVPGLKVFRTTTSYSGRVQYAVWLEPEHEGYLSLTKRFTLHPSELIMARHHANEVSSTNAAFLLIRELLTKEKWKDVPDRLNLVLCPMENIDGAAIHWELQKEHPYWKLHVARFDALGKEFFQECFRQDTIHTEAMGFTRLFERYLPDLIVDNHGVPTHEWEQQFSGYTSPSYKGFWLPRSLLYGYYWYVTDEEYHSNFPANKKMEDVIADRIAEDKEMTALNLEWTAQFEKYAHGWMPKLFPANYYKNMINYWIPFQYGPNGKYASIRFPWITTICYTSEVADETAQGDYLNLCARAHEAHDEATIEMLTKAALPMQCGCTADNGTLHAVFRRKRPFVTR